MSPFLILLGALALSAGTALFLVLAALLDRAGPIRVRHWAENAGVRLRGLYGSPQRFNAYRYLLGMLARVLPVALMAFLVLALAPAADSVAQAVLWAVTVVGVVVVASEAVARVFTRKAERSLDALTAFYRLVLAFFGPLLGVMAALFSDSSTEDEETALVELDEATDEEIEEFVNVGTQEGILEPEEGDMILRVIDFGDEMVRAVMTPRIDMVCARIDTPLDELASLFLSSNYSRIPLYDVSVDDIKGVLHIRDLLAALDSEKKARIEELALPPLFVPETKPLSELLRELQASHVHLALVVDEYGGTAGLVTIEDLLEEIVGEIVDEHDVDVREIEHLADGSYRLDGMTSLDAVSELFGLDLEEEPYETVGGMIFGLLGDLPEPGSEVVTHGLRIEVEKVDDRRVDSLRVVRLESAGEEPEAETE